MADAGKRSARRVTWGGLVALVVLGAGTLLFNLYLNRDRDTAERRVSETKALEDYQRAAEGIREAFGNGSAVGEIEKLVAATRRMEGKEFREIREASNPRRARQREVLGRLTAAVAHYRGAVEEMKRGRDARSERVRELRAAGDAALKEAGR